MKVIRKIKFKIKNKICFIFNYIFSNSLLFIMNLKNSNRNTIYVYTDSRGFNYETTLFYGNIFKTYSGYLTNRQKIKYSIQDYKYTTLLDLIDIIETKKLNDYDYIILQAGIVDFAPRPISSFNEMVKEKKHLLTKYNLLNEIGTSYDESFESEKLVSFASEKYIEFISKNLNLLLPKIIYIGINDIDISYKGTYWRKRPSNINEQKKLEKIFIDGTNLDIILSLNDISRSVKYYTTDNVHLNTNGHNLIIQELTKLGI